jgi:predicted dehydrogenase
MLKAGLVGLGWWGSTLIRVMKDSDAIAFVAATDIDPGRRSVAEAAGVGFLPSFEAVVGDREVQAVVLCTPHALHAEQIAAAARGRKHVFCEKPLALTRKDAEAAVAACSSAGRILGVGHERRFEPPIVDLMKRIDAGELGDIVQIEANFSQDKFLALPKDNWRVRGPGSVGPMTATGIHMLDLSVAVLGPADRVLASVRRLATDFENGDTVGLMVNFKSGANALISAILTTPFDGRFAVYGSQGWAEIRDKSHPEQSEGWVATYVRRGRDREVIDYPAAPAARFNLEAFARAAEGGQPYPIPAEQMIRTAAALEAVFASANKDAIAMVR